ELIALQPDLILSHNTPTTASLPQQTRTIPIVFVIVSDPVGSGFVASFPRPGGNITGFTNIQPTMAGKWLELLKGIAPSVARVALLFNPATAPYAEYAEYYLGPLKAAATSFAVEAIAAPVWVLKSYARYYNEMRTHHTPGPEDRQHHVTCAPRWTSSPIRSS